MKFHTASLFFLATVGLVDGFRDQSNKKQLSRKLEDEEECKSYKINHDFAQSTEEITVNLATYPSEGKGIFKITISDPPYATAENPVDTFGWCIDYERFIDKGDWSVDVFSAYDPDIHPTAVDKPEKFPHLAYLINNFNVGDTWEAKDDCEGGTITRWELQGAVWMLIDDEHGDGTWWQDKRVDCISQQIAENARANGKDYKLDCSDPNEQVPLVLVTDNAQKIVLNQTIISETNIHTIPGFCECIDDKTITDPPTAKTMPPAPTPAPTPTGSGSGDPHFKTWTGDKYDYHGECDLVLVDHPNFADGLGLKLHIRTTRVKYFSYIERAALQIGDDVLEFENDVENFTINGVKVEEQRKHRYTMLGGYKIRRDPKAISVRLADGTGAHQKTGAAKIDFIQRKNGFPAVVVNGGATNIFEGSLGLLGDWATGQTLARDGETVIPVSKHEATEFALEWQVRDDEPMLFQEARFPQFPNFCTPPAKMPEGRLGASIIKKEAEEACAHWTEDQEDCIFDVIATRDIEVASEGHHSVHVY